MALADGVKLHDVGKNAGDRVAIHVVEEIDEEEEKDGRKISPEMKKFEALCRGDDKVLKVHAFVFALCSSKHKLTC